MIQRIQSVFLLAAMIFLAMVSMGMTIFKFIGKESHYTLSAFGVNQYDAAGKATEISSTPFYAAGLVLLLFCFFTLVTYKNLKRQLAIGRLTAFVYFICIVLIVLAAFLGTYFTKEEAVTREFSLGFYLFLAGFPLVLLANSGIRRDKNLIDSVNRIR